MPNIKILLKKFIFKKYILEEKGAVTIWLTLLSLCMLVFVILVIEHIRNEQSNSACVQSSQTAIISAMADYEPDIYDNYHIFVLDECYGGSVKKKDKLKENILKYANMSVNPNYMSARKDMKDIIGCSVSKVNIANVKYFSESNDNFISQIHSYVECNQDKEKVSELIKKYGITKEKYYLCSYILDHFSSYKSLYVLGYMKRKYVYEIEYIIYGKDTDNDNIKKIVSVLGKDNTEEVTCSEEEYKEVLCKELVKVDKDKLCDRMKEIIINNINSTFDKNINSDCLVTSVDVEIEYVMEERATKVYLIAKWIGKRYDDKKIEYKEEFIY